MTAGQGRWLPFCSLLVGPRLKSFVQFWAPQHKMETELLERETEFVRRLEHPFYEGRQRELIQFHLGK